MKVRMKRKFNIWDRVLFKESSTWKVYTIYSYTRTHSWEVKYTLYSDNDYNSHIEQWQIKKYKPKNIWLNVEG